MQIAHLTPDYAVSPQISTEDVAALKAAGFTTVICNRPDHEVPPGLQAEALRAAVEAAGMTFVHNPVEGGTLGEEAVPVQREALEDAQGPVFAYCRSGNRSSVAWALAMAPRMPVDDILAAARAAGYDLGGLRPYLDAAARG
ncbi:TIGR01244 family sulfur transferase [Mangrovicoccus algicola]|uniref:TIGR01244 family phosphatase n=1 Tax=Mangrovicoccus algicola TaxID=2771008 RepID=A0A8J6Z048_9RHOB|nr:TIGR01244 family sulfur transferase [Mangrovicoccus algicola]MBE3639201.1 TIGR01244 family phosphatase [Mangrovicoccus algicola]